MLSYPSTQTLWVASQKYVIFLSIFNATFCIKILNWTPLRHGVHCLGVSSLPMNQIFYIEVCNRWIFERKLHQCDACSRYCWWLTYTFIVYKYSSNYRVGFATGKSSIDVKVLFSCRKRIENQVKDPRLNKDAGFWWDPVKTGSLLISKSDAPVNFKHSSSITLFWRHFEKP